MPPRPRKAKRRTPKGGSRPRRQKGARGRAGQDSTSRESQPETAQRLQKVLAAAGLGSRRHCEELIAEGRVEIDRQLVTELGTKVDPLRQEIRVDGEAIPRTQPVYYLLHKPTGVVSTAHDPAGRPRAIDLVPDTPRVFTVGRLDMSSEGLILLTNDGELAHGLTHPRYGVDKVYLVLVAGQMKEDELREIRNGVYLAEGFARVANVKLKSREKRGTWLEMVLREGQNREIRRILARVGHKVQRLRRVAMGGVRLGDVPEGAFRELKPEEVETLRQAIRNSRRRAQGEKRTFKPRPQPAIASETRKTSAPQGDKRTGKKPGQKRTRAGASAKPRRKGRP